LWQPQPEQQVPQFSFKPAPIVVSSANLDVVAIRSIVGLKQWKAFRRFPYKLRRCECGRFENRSGEWISRHRSELSIFAESPSGSLGRSRLAAGGHKPSFDNCFRIAVSQTRGSEVGPNLLETIRGMGSDFEPICLCQCNSLPGFHFGGKCRQGNHRGSQKCEYRKGCKRFDHWDC
jgi:hypothetical protein